MEKSLEETTIELPVKVPTPPAPSSDQVAVVEPTAEGTSSPEEPTSHADSLSHLLPANSFAQISPRCYMFPGAEVTLENMDGGESEDSDDDFSEEDDDDDNESSANTNEIIVPDIDNVIEVPVPEISPASTISSALSPAPSSSHLQCNDREAAENIIDIQADEATEDLEPAPIKRQRLENEGETIC